MVKEEEKEEESGRGKGIYSRADSVGDLADCETCWKKEPN